MLLLLLFLHYSYLNPPINPISDRAHLQEQTPCPSCHFCNLHTLGPHRVSHTLHFSTSNIPIVHDTNQQFLSEVHSQVCHLTWFLPRSVFLIKGHIRMKKSKVSNSKFIIMNIGYAPFCSYFCFVKF